MEPVRSHRARSVVEASRLHRARERRERGLTLVEGPELIRDISDTGAQMIEVFGIDPPEGSGIIPVDQRALDRLAGTTTPRGPVAVVEIPTEWLDRERNLLVSVGVSDPGNVGTMIRTAAAFGWGFAYTEGSADPWSPKTIRAGAGGQFQTSIARIGSISELAEWITIATVVSKGDPPDTMPGGRLAVLVGEEANGLPEKVIGAAGHRLSIPTPGPTESLNAAIAAGIAVYALSDRSGQTGSDV